MAAPTGLPAVDLLTAALDLKLVQLLRGAMRAADVAAGTGQAAHPLGPRPDPEPDIRGPRRYEPDPVYLPRRIITPEPRYLPREVIRPRPRVEVQPPIPLPCEPCACDGDDKRKLPLPPPWKILPWETPVQPPQKIKVVRAKPDIVRTGSLIDCFM